MGYINRVLLGEERVEARPRLSRMAQYGAPTLEFLASVAVWSLVRTTILAYAPEVGEQVRTVLTWAYYIGLGVFTARFLFRMTFRFLRMLFREIAVTNRRYMEKTGVLSVSFYSTDLEKIVRLAIEQSFLGRIFDYGDVTIVTVGEVRHTTQGVARPILLQQAMHARMTGDDGGAGAGLQADALNPVRG